MDKINSTHNYSGFSSLFFSYSITTELLLFCSNRRWLTRTSCQEEQSPQHEIIHKFIKTGRLFKVIGK